MSKVKRISVSWGVFNDLMSGEATEVTYAMGSGVKKGEELKILCYDNVDGADNYRMLDGKVVDVQEVTNKKGIIMNYRIVLNVQLILF